MVTTEEVKDAIGADTLSLRKGIYTARRSFFYGFGYDSIKFAKKIKKILKNVEIIDHGEKWVPFKGGHTVSQGSHWWVQFKIVK